MGVHNIARLVFTSYINTLYGEEKKHIKKQSFVY